MYLITLPQDLISRNEVILRQNGEYRLNHLPQALVKTVINTPTINGILYKGYNQVSAQVTSGSHNSVELTFELSIPSISAATFAYFRNEVRQKLGSGEELQISTAAGIGPYPPPKAETRMASYGVELFAKQIIKEVDINLNSFDFNGMTASLIIQKILQDIRLLPVEQIKFSGSIALNSNLTTTQSISVYLPISTVVFSDGLTIPFSAYASNAVITEIPIKTVSIPYDFWA
ncbi:hypothetical protein [Shewanella mangrovisoli]|uniref:hypothetical protein n=1 Tax=Shewanella mangrovisoli TaxID=2864211 RepID=UPI0035BA00C4